MVSKASKRDLKNNFRTESFKKQKAESLEPHVAIKEAVIETPTPTNEVVKKSIANKINLQSSKRAGGSLAARIAPVFTEDSMYFLNELR